MVRVLDTELPEVKLIKPCCHRDDRGLFYEVWRDEWCDLLPGCSRFVQDNHSFSQQGVLRGLHYQIGKPQGKLVRVVEGTIFDVAVDVRADSPTFGLWVGYELSQNNGIQMWIPPGFAHGFYVLSSSAITLYKCTDYYDPASERTIHWRSPDLNIPWPLISDVLPCLSAKDASASARLTIQECG